MLLGAVAFRPLPSFAYQIGTFAGYLYSGVSTVSGSDSDVRQYAAKTNIWDFGGGYSDVGTDLKWSFTSTLKRTWIDEPSGIYKTSGTLEWTVTNCGAELNDVRFFGLLDGWIEYGFDSAGKASGFSVDASIDPVADYWEIDDVFFGDILNNLDSGVLDNSAEDNLNGFPSMALGFDIGTLLPGESFTASFILSEDALTNGLRYYNDVYPDEEIYFKGIVSSGPGTGSPVPIPPTLILLGSGLLCLIGIGNRKRYYKKYSRRTDSIRFAHIGGCRTF